MATKTKEKKSVDGSAFEMSIRTMRCHITGMSPVSFSRPVDTTLEAGETGPNDVDRRIWRDKALVDADGYVVFNPAAMMFAITEGAKRLGKRAGKGNATWTAPFKSAVVIPKQFHVLDAKGEKIHRDDTEMVSIHAHGDGKRTCTTRVTRRFPVINDWTAVFEATVLDAEISTDVFVRALATAGIYNGIGRWSPRAGGVNGRWTVDRCEWSDE